MMRDFVGIARVFRHSVAVCLLSPLLLAGPACGQVPESKSSSKSDRSDFESRRETVVMLGESAAEEHPSYGCGGSAQPPLVRIGDSEPPAAVCGNFEPADRNTGSLGAGGGRGSVHRALWRVWSALLTQAA